MNGRFLHHKSFLLLILILFCISFSAIASSNEEPLLSDAVKMGFTSYDNIDGILSNYGFTGTDILTIEKVDLIQRTDGKYESPVDVPFNFFSVVRTPLLYTIMFGATPIQDMSNEDSYLPLYITFDDVIEPLHVDVENPDVPDTRILFSKNPGYPSVTKFYTPFRIVSDASGSRNTNYTGQIYISLITDKTIY